MKYLITFIGFLLLLSCKKESTPTPQPNQPTTFTFDDLNASSYQIRVGSIVSLSAITSGEVLSYEWFSKDKNNNYYGTFFGGGSQVEWSVCHADSFYITCTATGISSQKLSKTIIINVIGTE